jgi:hypothetical protein
MTDKILENLILHKSARDQWLRNLILEAISSPFELDGPPSQLTRALILIEAINPDLVGESIELIENEYSKGVGEIRNLIETVIAFNKHSKMKNLASAALPWASTNNWHKFSCMFGSRTEIQQAAAELLETSIGLLTSKITDLKKIYPLLVVAYCQGAQIFEQVLKKCQPKLLEDVNLISRRFFEECIRKNLGPKRSSAESTVANQSTLLVGRSLKKLKIALCISGQLRGFRKAAAHIQNLGLEMHDVDTFVHTWKMVGGRFPAANQAERIFSPRMANAYKMAIVGKNEDEMEKKYPSLAASILNRHEVTKEELTEIYRTDAIVIEDDREVPYSTFPAIAKMHLKMERCFALACSSGKNYDLIIRIRPDLLIPNRLDCDWNNLFTGSQASNTIYTDFGSYISPRISQWTIGETMPLMVGDLFAVGARELMGVYMNSFSINNTLINEQVIGLPRGIMAHTTLSRILMYHGIYADTFPYAKLDGKNLLEHTALSPKAAFGAILQDISTRVPDPGDVALFNAALEDLKSTPQT